jgi:surfactin family lipopeptide synthetase A
MTQPAGSAVVPFDLIAEKGRAVFPLSLAQRRVWMLEQIASGTAVHHVALLFRVNGPLDLAALEFSLAHVVARHEVLNTTFPVLDGEPVQRVGSVPRFSFRQLRLSATSPGHGEDAAERIILDEARRPFDFASEPLLRAMVVQLSSTEHLFLLVSHQLVLGGSRSLELLVDEIGAAYRERVSKTAAVWRELPLQFGHCAIRQGEQLDSGTWEELLQYWRASLAEAPATLELPTDWPRPPVQSYRGAMARIVVSPSLSSALRESDRGDSSVTAFAGLLALLSRYTGQRDLVVGVPHELQRDAGAEALIGPFGNMFPVRVTFAPAASFCELVECARASLRDARAHSDLPYERIIEELVHDRDLSRTPLFQVVFSPEETTETRLFLGGLTVRRQQLHCGTATHDLALRVREHPNGVAFELEFSTDLFDRRSAERLLDHLVVLLEAATRAPTTPVNALPLLTERERQEILVRWNATEARFPRDRCVHELIEQQVDATPDRIAVVDEQSALTYGELNARAEEIADRLAALGVVRGTLVGIAVRRRVDMLVGLLGIWKAGGAYLPLDPDFPTDRLAFMMADAPVEFLLTERGDMPALPPFDGGVLYLDDPDPGPTIPRQTPAGTSATDLAYVLYTSGSTGRPKGVEIRHVSVVNLLLAIAAMIDLSSNDVLVAVTTLSFDIAGLELWMPLLVGAQVVIANRHVTRDGRQLAAMLERTRATIMQATPATWRILLEEKGWRSLRLTALCGGEALPNVLAAELLSRCGALWNVYGPTETTIWSTAFRVKPEATPGDGVVPLGRPLANTCVYVVDPAGQPVPVGVPGELLIGGAGVARGYRGREALTAERFVADTLGPTRSDRVYRTGDRVRWRANGVLDFLGRLDDQVKLRGFRIELGEIESVLSSHPQVAETAVLLEGQGDAQQLVSYFTTRDPKVRPEANELRTLLRSRLPDYMVPATFVPIEQFPRTPNGKLDRRALTAQRLSPLPSNIEVLRPRDDVERRVAVLWERVLGRTNIGIHDDFFELGGHSIVAVRLSAAIEQEFGLTLPLGMLFQAPTIEGVAAFLKTGHRDTRWSSLVPIQLGTGLPPFFCVHAVGGHVMNLRDLLLQLPKHQPVWALQARGLDGNAPLLNDFGEMARHYISEMRSVQPNGPYYVGGLSLGGVIAYEMAQQLQEAGEQVALVALLDTHLHHTLLPWRLRLYFYMMKLRQYAQSAIAGELHEKTFNVRSSVARRLRGTRALQSSRLPGQPDTSAPTLEEVQEGIAQAMVRYRPRPYRGRVTLIRAIDPHPDMPTDPAAEWAPWVHGTLEIRNVPGDHMSMFEVHVATLAECLRQCLEEARERVAGDRAG